MLYFNNFYKIPIEEFEDNHNEMKAIVLQKYAHAMLNWSMHTIRTVTAH